LSAANQICKSLNTKQLPGNALNSTRLDSTLACFEVSLEFDFLIAGNLQFLALNFRSVFSKQYVFALQSTTDISIGEYIAYMSLMAVNSHL